MSRQRKLVDHIRHAMREQVEGGGLRPIINQHNLTDLLDEIEYICNSPILDLCRKNKLQSIADIIDALNELLVDMDTAGYERSDIYDVLSQLHSHISRLDKHIRTAPLEELSFAANDALNMIYIVNKLIREI